MKENKENFISYYKKLKLYVLYMLLDSLIIEWDNLHHKSYHIPNDTILNNKLNSEIPISRGRIRLKWLPGRKSQSSLGAKPYFTSVAKKILGI